MLRARFWLPAVPSGRHHRPDRLIEEVEKSLLAEKMAQRGDNLVILMGAPIYKKGTPTLMKV